MATSRMIVSTARCAALLLLMMAFPALHAQVSVVTAQNDNARTSANLSESTLTTSNVNVNQFGKVFSRAVDGYIYAQPLYLPNVSIAGGVHNVVYVATMNDSLYAFDADNPSASTPLWQVSLGTAVPATAQYLPNDQTGGLAPQSGILSTPVIDASSGTLYAVALVLQGGVPVYQLHAINIQTGAEKSNSPVVIQGSLAGTGPDSQGGSITFLASQHLQRTGLLLTHGKIYFGFASYSDIDPYHGWIFGYDASTLQQSAIQNLTPGGEGGVWQSGGGLSADAAGFIFVCTGNGTWDGVSNFGESCVKLDPSQSLAVVDYFTPYNYDPLNQSDSDLGSGRALLIPGTNYLVTGGKQSLAYVLDRKNLGHISVGDSNVVQRLYSDGRLFSGMAYWDNPTSPSLFIWGSNDILKAYRLTGGVFDTNPSSVSTVQSPYGPGLTVSANGGTAGSGIVWATTPSSAPGASAVPGTVHAFDASNVATELWNSDQNSGRDSLGNIAKFAAPTVANGKVYVPTFSNQLVVYGTLSTAPQTITPPSATLGAAQVQQFSSNTPANFTVAPPVGTVSSNGLYTAPSSVASQQTVAVTATNSSNSSQQATATVTLIQVSINVNPSTAGLFGAQTQQFTATVLGSSNAAVTWSIGPTDPGSISTGGLYTAPASIASTQTVTVKATSAADNTKTATATVTLNPPAVPAIVQSPKNVSVFVGATATFRVTATGAGLTYQWQSKASGAGSFTAIASAVSSTYTTPVTTLTNDGTQFRCVVTSSQGPATSSAATLSVLATGSTFLLTEKLGTTRNDFSGWVGLAVTPGPTPMVVSALGRFVAPGNTATHTVKIVDGTTGNDIAGASVSINLADGAQGTFVYRGLAAPVTLAANTTYFILSQETAGGDLWYDFEATTAVTTTDAVLSGAIYGPPYAYALGSVGHVYVPVDFIYRAISVAPATATLYASQTQQFTAALSGLGSGVTWTISPVNAGSISAAGLYTAPSLILSSQSVTVTATSVSDPTKSSSATITLNPVGVSVTPPTASLFDSQTQQFSATVANNDNTAVTWTITPSGVGSISSTGLYSTPASVASTQTVTVTARSVADNTKVGTATVTLNPPAFPAVSLQPVGLAVMVGQSASFTVAATGGGLSFQWQAKALGAGSFTNIAGATSPVYTISATTLAQSGTQFRCVVTNVNGTATSNGAVLTVVAPGIKFVTSVTPSTLRNDYSGWVGMNVVVGPTPLTINSLGRLVAAGNTGTHTVKIVDDITGNDLPGGAVQVVTAGATVGAFAYGALQTPVVLNAGGVYDILTQETAGGDQFYNSDTAAQTLDVAVLNGPDYGTASPFTFIGATVGQMFGPVDFSMPISISVAPTTGSLLNGQTLQFGATVSGSNPAVAWSISPNVGSISAAGLYTAPSSIATNQTITVTATVLADITKSASAAVTLNPVGVSVTPPTASLFDSQTQQFSATISNSGNSAVVWSINPAGVGSISAAGLYTAPASVAATQTVSVIATSVADNTQAGTATVTLNPPGTPAVTFNPQNLAVMSGQPASFTVAATGGGLFYQWQSKAPGASSFTAISGATSPLYTISSATLAQSGTQFRAAVSNTHGTAFSNPAVLTVVAPGIKFVTSVTPVTLRNDFTGWVGMNIVVGPTPLILNSLGRMVAPGNTGTHTVKIVDDSTGIDLAGATVQVVTAGATSGTFAYGALQTPIVLNAGGVYDILTQETSGGDKFYDSNTAAQTLDVAVLNGPEYGTAAPFNFIGATVGKMFGPVDFSMPISISVAPPTGSLLDGQTLQFSATITGNNSSVAWSITPNVGSISAAGLYTAPGAINSVQTITITGTSLADITKTASATVTLNPPPAPTITSQPHSTAVSPGQAASFSVTATSVGLSYQWQTAPSGSSSFTNVSGATSSSFTTPAMAIADNGTQFRVIVTNHVGSITSSAATVTVINATTTPFVIPAFLGTSRNDFSGWIGIKVTVGPTALIVSSLGRYVVPGNTGVHAMKIVDANTVMDIPGGATTVNTSAGTAGSFAYSALPVSITLSPNSTYYIVSQETAGGDFWYDYDTLANSDSHGALTGTIYGDGTTYSENVGSGGRAYGPLNFQFVTLDVAPASVVLTSSQTQQFTGVGGAGSSGVAWSISPTVGTISAGGLYTAPSVINAIQVITVTATSLADSNISATATVTLSGITQQPQDQTVFAGQTASFSVVSTGSGLTYQWKSKPAGAGSFTAIPGATSSTYTTPPTTVADSGTQFLAAVNSTQGLFSSSAANLTVLSAGSTFLTSSTPGTLRNNYTGSVGMTVAVGPNPLVVTSLGRMVAPGNTGTHILKLVNASTGTDIPNGAVSINTTGATAGSFVYAALPAPLTLSANASYYVLSQETSGGDKWYDHNTVVQTTADATLAAAIQGPPYVPVSGSVNNPFGPVDFTYISLAVSPATVTLGSSQTQQFGVTASGVSNAVTWSISPNVGTITAAGLYTAPALISSTQTITVTATSQVTGLVSAVATITLLPVTVGLTPSGISLSNTQTQQYTATVSNSANSSVTWTITPNVGSISASGLYTAPAVITAQQTVTITATSVTDVTKFASVTVTLLPLQVALTPAGISLNGAQTQQYTATVTNSADTSVTWTISPNVGSISTAGLYTAPSLVAAQQTVTITAKSTVDVTKSASVQVTLVPIAISTAPPTATLVSVQTQQFTATVTHSANTSVTWSITPNGAGSISAAGLYTPPVSIATIQTVTVTATSVADGTKTASSTVTLNPDPPAITQQPVAVTVYEGASPSSFTVTASGLNLTYQWQSMAPGGSSFTNIAGATTNSFTPAVPVLANSGTQYQCVVTNPQGFATSTAATLTVLSAGATFLTSTTPDSNHIRNDFTGYVGMSFVVGPTPLTVRVLGRIVLPGNTATHIIKLVSGDSGVDLPNGSVTINTANGTPGSYLYSQLANPIILAANTTYYVVSQETLGGDNWYDKDASATTTADGTLLAAVFSPSTTTYTPAPGSFGHLYGTVDFKYVAMGVLPTAVTRYASQTQQFTAVVTGIGSTSVNWTLNPPTTGTISAAGVYTAPSLIPTATSVTVTATSTADPTKSASATVTLNPVTIGLTPASVNLFPSQTQQYTATLTGTDNTTILWTMNPSVGTLSATGLYTAPSSIATNQNVTITATSAADGSKLATASILLSPPAPPVINQQVPNVSVDAGQNAAFTVTAVGPGLSYQWQSMAVGASTFTNIAGADNVNFYVTPPTSVTDNGTQFRVVITNVHGTLTSNVGLLAVAPAPTPFITSTSLGALQNDFTGWVGMSMTTGNLPLTIRSLGRIVAPGNTGTHDVKIVDATTGIDVPGAIATVNTNGATLGSYAYTALASPVVLNPNTLYYVLSQETKGGENWYDSTTVVQTTSAGTVNGPVYGTPYIAQGPTNSLYVPTNFLYSIPVSINVTPTTATLFGTQTQQFSATVVANGSTAVTWSVSPSGAGSISSGGLYTAPSSVPVAQTVTVTATSVTDITKTASATVTLNPPAPPIITQNPQSATALVGQTATFSVTASGIGLSYQWKSMAPGAGSFSNISGATSASYTTPTLALADNARQYLCVVTNAQGSVSSTAATVTVISPGSPFVTSKTLGTLRNNFTGWVGMQLTVGSSGLVVTSLGRIVAPGNTAAHTVKIVDATTSIDVPGGSVSINTASGTSGQFAYANLPTPLALNANTSYFIISQETSNADQWYDNNSVIQTTSDAVLAASAYGTGSPFSTVAGSTGRMYVPLDFKYNLAVSVNVTPPTVSLYAAQTQQFNATVTGSGNTAVTWSINPSTAGSISASGLYTAPASVPAGTTVTVIATSSADFSKTASATVTLQPVSLTVAPGTVSMFRGQAQQFIATVAGNNNTAVTWSISPTNAGSISAGGIYTAPASVPAGQTVTITATSVADNTKFATSTVTLQPVAVTVAPPTASLFDSQTQQFAATITGATDTTVTWTITPNGTGTISAAGLYTAPAPITTTQTVTVKATSVADNTKTATATVTLNPPAAPVITQQPQALTAFTGLTATFTTVATGGGLSYDWQSKAAGAGAFIDIPGAVTNTYTTPALTPADNGTQFRVIVANGQGIATSVPVTMTVALPGLNFISSYTLGQIQNDFTGWVGMSMTVGPNPISVNSLGRVIGVGNTGTHAMKIVDAATGADVPGATASINTLGGTVGTMRYSFLPSPVTLNANATYYILSQEIHDGENWYDSTTVALTSSVGTINGPVFGTGAPYSASGPAGHLFVPVDFTYTGPISVGVAPPTVDLFGGQTQQFAPVIGGTSYNAVTWSVSPTNLGSITDLGLYSAPGAISAQTTVTVTATSLADNTKTGTAIITLHPPLPPSITQDPQNATAVNGQTATFTVTAAGGGLTYQWQSKAPGAGVFTNVGGPLSSYTTPPTALTDSSTQIRVIVTNSQGSVTSNAATLAVVDAGTNFITSVTLGALQNDFTGWVGMQMTVGPAPMIITSLGRVVGPGNTAVHTVKIVNAATGVDVPGGSTTVGTSGDTPGTFVYSGLASPVTLSANTAYYIVSQETKDGDTFYDSTSFAQTTSAAVINGPVYGPPYTSSSPVGSLYGPIDFTYTVPVAVTVTPTTASLFNSQTQQFAATVISAGSTAVTWTMSPNVGTLSSNGLYTAPSSITSTQTVTVTATSVADVTKSSSATVTLNPPAPPVITQQPQNAAAVVGQNAVFNVTATGLNLTYQWQIMAPGAGSFTNIAGALSSSYVTPATALADSGSQFKVIVTNAQGSTTSSAVILSVLTPGSPFVTSTTLGTLRNDYNGPVGMKFTVGSKPLVVSSLGRIVVSGNTGTHTLKLIDAATGTMLASASVATSGGTSGTFAYTNLVSPITLNANASYYVVSLETQGGDQWYENNTTAVTTTDATLAGSAYGDTTSYTGIPMPGRMYVPVNFKYVVSSSVGVLPIIATVSASQNVQFTGTVNGGGNTAVTWSMSPSVGTLSSSGLYTAPAFIATAQTITVTATSVADVTKSASATVTLAPVSVTLAPSTISLFPTQTQQFTPTVNGSTNSAVTWSINPSNVGSISGTGQYIAPSTIASTQTVTVTAFSVADSSKFGTATITLNPPAPPVITLAPQSTSIATGQTANFSVTATGAGVTYQWQIMPSGGSFSNISGATTSSYTTSVLSIADSGTQFRVVVTNPQGSVTSSAATVTVQAAGLALVTSKTLGQTRNNYTGFVGMKITVGSSPMTVIALGRIVGPGNSASHIVKIVDPATSNDVASTTVATLGGTTGTFAYGSLGSPVTLLANTSYYIVSQETAGGDQWYDLDTTLTTTSAATVGGPVYGTPYAVAGTGTHSYVPVDLKYSVSVSVSVAPPTATLFDAQTQQFTVTVNGTSNQSVTWTLSPNVGTISTAGLYTAPAPITTTQTITVTGTSVADPTKSGTATITLSPPAPPVITQQPQSAAAIAGQSGSFSVAASGLGLSYQWQVETPGASSFTNIAGALASSYTTPNVTAADSGTQYRVIVTNAQGSVTSSAATLSVLTSGVPFLTSITPGNQRNDFTGWVGMKITVGPTPLLVSSLGRIIVPGNNHGHYLKIVDGTTGNDLGIAAMATVGGTPNTFVYGNLTTPITLNANATYYILSEEENQVDQWYDNSTVGVPTSDATLVGSTYGSASPFTTYPVANHLYVGVNFKYTASAAVNINPTAVTLSASQTQQFTSSATGGVTWSFSPNVGTLSGSGLYTAPASIATAQSVIVTATSVTDNTKTATATVSLVPVAITTAPPTATLFATQTQQFTATVTGASNTSVNWTISPNVGTISGAGLYTAPSSIASSQTVTVTATSAADNTKFATSAVTLTPPAPPVITVAPQNASSFAGQTATFSVTATGLNLTYQWQIMPSGGSFSNISGATSSTYTTAALTLADSGTQFKVIVTNAQGSVPSTVATLSVLQAGTTLVTSRTLGTTRNNFTGWVGMAITVGPSPMTVSAVGRMVGPTNTLVHTVKIVDAITSNDVASASVSTTGLAPGTFAYGSIGSPVTLNANATYYIVSQETLGGDLWYDLDSTVQTTTAAAVTGPVYGTPYAAGGPAGHAYVPVDLKYFVSVSVTMAPPTASLFAGQTQQFTATVNGAGNTAVTWTLSPNVGTISSGGLYTAPSSITSTQTITATATSVADVTKTATATITLNPPSPPVITQQPQGATAIAGQTASFSVTATGLGLSYQWQIMPIGGSFSNIAGATSSSYTTPTTALADSGTQFRVVVTNGQGSVTSSAAGLAVLTPGSPFVTSTVLGPLRNDYSGFVGMKFTVGSSSLVVSSLGRIVAPGNGQAHTVKIVDAATGNDLGTVSIATSGGTVGSFAYSNLASPVTLNANASYYVVSQETLGGDQWYDNSTTAQTTADGTLVASVYGTASPLTALATAGRMYVPVNFKYAVASSVIVAPSAASLSASQTQQFSATINGGNTAVTWSISPNVGSISSSGLYTAPASIASTQTVTVTATSVADSTKSSSATVTLTPIGVTLAPASISLSGGQTQQFTQTVTGTNNSGVTWTINPNVGTISTAGFYTAPASVTSAQSITVTATSAADNTKSGSATVNLVPVGVTVTPPTASLFASQTQLYTATVTGTANTSVTWTITPSGTGSISTAGLYTAPSSIASTQTVTVTATSVADNTKLGTATVTLNPPAPPAITQQPQAATATTGQTATFSVTASGLSLTYQWQSMPSGGSFANIGGATSSSYTTPATAGSDNGTQFRCVVTNPQGSATSNPATLTVQASGVSLITSRTLGTPRNNFSGWVGMTITVGSSPMTVSSIGRFIGLHDTNAHTLKIVDASNGNDLAVVSVNTIGATPGTTVYGILSTPVTLNANATYYVVSQETGGADDWYDADSLVQTTSAATVTGPLYGLPYTPTVLTSHTYVILDLKYSVPVSVSVTPTSASMFNNQTQQFTATVTGTSGNTSVTWTLNPNVGTISTAGLYTAPSSITSTQSITVTATSVADSTKSGSAAITLNPPAPPAITQQPQSATTLVGQTATFSVTASGMGLTYQWQSMPSGGSFANIGGATSSSYTTPAAALADNGTQFRCVVTNGQGSATSNAATLTVSTGTKFVTSTTPGRLRSDYGGWLGVKVTVGNASMVVGALGRLVAPGNVGVHTVKIVNATTGSDIASVSIPTSGGTSGTYVYTALTTPVTLAANTSYYILSLEGQNSDGWYDNDTTVTTTSDGTITGSVYGAASPFTAFATPGRMYIPVDFKYALGQ